MDFIVRRIFNEMKKKNWDQSSLSKKAGVSQSTINRTLNAGTNSRIGTLNKIARALDVPVEYLVIEDETKALLCLEIAKMNKEETHQALLHFEKEKLYKELKKVS